MKAVILAAGRGSRINSLSVNKPKSLLPIENTTLIGKSLNNFWSEGIKEIVVVTGYKSKILTEYLQSNWKGKLEIVCNPNFKTTNVLYSFSLAIPFLKGHDFIFHHADTVFDKLILKKLMDTNNNQNIILAVQKRKCGLEEMKVKIKRDNIISLSKEMNVSEAYGEFLGIARIKSSQLKNLTRATKTLLDEKKYQSFFEASIQLMIDDFGSKINFINISNLPWCEIDFPEDYYYAKSIFEVN